MDAATLGVPKGWIIIGHNMSEESGMQEMADWLKADRAGGEGPARARRRRLLGAEVNRRGAADDLHQVRETPRAAERRDDDPSEGRRNHHHDRSLRPGLRLQQGVTSAAQSARAALGDVAGPQARDGWPGCRRPARRHDQRSCCISFLECRDGGRLAEFLRERRARPRQALAQRLGTDPAHHRRVGGRQALVTDEQQDLPVLR